MREKKNNTEASNHMGTVKEEIEAVKSHASNAGKKASKVQGAVRKKRIAKKEELRPEVVIQYAGNAVLVEKIVEKVKKMYLDDGHYLASLKSLQVYVKPEENAAYYVINKKRNGKIDLF